MVEQKEDQKFNSEDEVELPAKQSFNFLMSKKREESEAYRKVRKSILQKRREYKKRSASMCRPVMAKFFFGSPTKK